MAEGWAGEGSDKSLPGAASRNGACGQGLAAGGDEEESVRREPEQAKERPLFKPKSVNNHDSMRKRKNTKPSLGNKKRLT